MKKFFKFYLPTFIFLGALGLFVLIYLAKNDAAILKYIAGELGLEGKGKIISNNVDAVVKEDGVEQDNIKVLKNNDKIYLVFEKTDTNNFGVLVIDTAKNDILTTNTDCMDFLLSKYLVQAEGGIVDYFGSEKNSAYNTKLELNDSQIKFQLPEYNYDKYVTLKRNRQMEIIFTGEQ